MCTRVSSGPLYIGGPRRLPLTRITGERLRWCSARSGWLGGRASSRRFNGSVLVLNWPGFGCKGRARRNGDGAGPSAAESAFRACRPWWLCYGRALACMRPRGEPGSDGRRRTAFCRGVPPVGRHGRARRRRRRRRGRASALPTPGRLHARVCSFGQEEEAARNVPRALWPRD